MNRKKLVIIISTIILISIVIGFFTTVYGRDNLAFEAGTTNGINTVQDVNDAIETIYYFDIETEKKYVTFSIPTATENGVISYHAMKYEIK